MPSKEKTIACTPSQRVYKAACDYARELYSNRRYEAADAAKRALQLAGVWEEKTCSMY